MNMLLPLILLASGPAPADPPQTFLVSIIDVPLRPGESLEGFALSTWGATFNAVCRIPAGWTVTAGGSLSPEGVLEGEGGQGGSWLRETSPAALRDVALVTLSGPVRRDAVRSVDGSGEVPATFAGTASISTSDGDRQIPLTATNVRLTSADRCPERQGR